MAKKWKLRWRENGRHRQETFASRSERDLFKLELSRPKQAYPWITFGEFGARWLVEHAQLVKAASTVEMEKAFISRYLMPALEDVQLRELRKSTLIELRGKWATTAKLRGGKPLAPKTVNNLLGLAKSMLEVAVDWELIPSNPWAKVEPLKIPQRSFAYWTAEDRDKFIAACKHEPELRDLVLTACHTGLRKGELKALTCGALDFKAGLIRVEATYNEKLRQRLLRTKNGKVQYVPMNGLVMGALRDREGQPADAPVFDPRLFADLNGRLRRRCVQFGVRKVRPHDLRHTFASTLVAGGAPIYTVQKLMRHGSLAMTERYAHLAQDHLRDAVEGLCTPGVRDGSGEPKKDVRLQVVRWRSQQGSNIPTGSE